MTHIAKQEKGVINAKTLSNYRNAVVDITAGFTHPSLLAGSFSVFTISQTLTTDDIKRLSKIYRSDLILKQPLEVIVTHNGKLNFIGWDKP